jgi:predicted ATPase
LDEPVYHFKGRAYPLLQNSSYSLARSLFSFRFQIHDSDAPAVVWEKLVQGLGALLGQNDPENRKVFFIGRLLGFELGDTLSEQASLPDARQFQEQALGYLLDYFRALAQKYPAVVLLEDIHWADNSSFELIGRMSGSLAKQPLLIVCTARTELFARRPDWGENLAVHNRLELQPLALRESYGLVDEILQEVELAPDELRDLLVERAEGNPFFIEEGIKMLIDAGVIEKSTGHWKARLELLTQVKIPPTLEGLLQARLDSLYPRQRVLLQRAAVLGRVFWDQAVEFLGKKENGHQTGDDAATQETLEDLRAREIIYLQKQSAFVGTAEYLFKHALFRDVTYGTLLKRARRAYHARAARWLEQMAQNSSRTDENATLIAQHYEQAGDSLSASYWYRRAGKLAASRFANVEAVHAFSRALELTPANALQDAYKIVLAREQVLDRIGDRQSQRNDLDQLLQFAEAIGDAAIRSEVELRRANFGFATADYSSGISAARRAITLAQAAGSVENEARGYYIWGRSLDFQQAGPESFEKFEKALELARAAGLARLEADILMSLGPHFSDQNKYAESIKYLTAALRIFRQLDDRHGEAKRSVTWGLPIGARETTPLPNLISKLL